MAELPPEELGSIKPMVEECLEGEVRKSYKGSVEEVKILRAKLDGLVIYVSGEVSLKGGVIGKRMFALSIHVVSRKMLDITWF